MDRLVPALWGNRVCARCPRGLGFAYTQAKMWPMIFGPGWVWGVLVALALSSLFAGVLGLLLLVMNNRHPSRPQPLDQAWHRYEEGDITREEFERLRHLEEVGRP